MNRLIAGCCLLVALAACKPSGDASKAEAGRHPARPRSQAAKPKSPAVSQDANALAAGQHDRWRALRSRCASRQMGRRQLLGDVVHAVPEGMPELVRLDAMREHIEVIGLAYDDIEPAELKTFLKKHPVVYPIAIVDTYTHRRISIRPAACRPPTSSRPMGRSQNNSRAGNRARHRSRHRRRRRTQGRMIDGERGRASW
jgi:hypothetical protein